MAQGTVYKNVDKEGVPSFSDQPSPGAKSIEIKPNIINVAPVKPLPPSAKKTPRKTTNNRQSQEYRLRDPDDYDHSYGYNYNDDEEYERLRYRRYERSRNKHKREISKRLHKSGASKPDINNNSRPGLRPSPRPSAGGAPRASIGGGPRGGGGHP